MYSFINVPNFPNNHWSKGSAWEIVKCLAIVEVEDLREKVKQVQFISLSLYKVIVVENIYWVCIHLYNVENHLCEPHLLAVHKMVKSSNSKNPFKLVISSLKDIARMDDHAIAKKLMCVGADGIAMMQGHRNGLYVYL